MHRLVIGWLYCLFGFSCLFCLWLYALLDVSLVICVLMWCLVAGFAAVYCGYWIVLLL